MKNKFDIVYESIIDELEKSKVNYQSINEFKDQIKDELNHLKETETEESIKSYLEFIYNRKINRGYPPVREDRLIALKEVCKEVLNKELKDIIQIGDLK